MKHLSLIAFSLASLAVILVSPVNACSVVSDYRVPTNLELVGQSQLILRGRVVGEVEGEDQWDRGLLIEPLEALRGELPPATIEISGSGLVPHDDERGLGVLSNPFELEGAHPLSYIGGCIRYMFPQGTTALFFLEQVEGEWRPAGGPFSRWAEDVTRDDAPWMVLARFYAEVVEADPMDRKALLEAERDRLRGREGDPIAALMATDIERQIAGPNEEWNTIMRRAIDGDGEVPAGAEAEFSAAAVASLILEVEGSDSEEGECTFEGDTVTCETSIEAQADTMEEEALVLCDLSADAKSVECEGTVYREVAADEDVVAAGDASD